MIRDQIKELHREVVVELEENTGSSGGRASKARVKRKTLLNRKMPLKE
jgi:hypothetical protein